MERTQSSNIRTLAMIAVMTALTCILAPMSLYIGPIPISFTNFVIYITLYLLGWKAGMVSYLVYVLIGLVGMPVFSGYTGGLTKLVSLTGGYIVGFIPMAIIAGLVIEYCNWRPLHFIAMVVGTAVCYALGTAWFCYVADSTLSNALALCVYPFIAVDLVKIIIAMVLGPAIAKRLQKAKVIPETTT